MIILGGLQELILLATEILSGTASCSMIYSYINGSLHQKISKKIIKNILIDLEVSGMVRSIQTEMEQIKSKRIKLVDFYFVTPKGEEAILYSQQLRSYLWQEIESKKKFIKGG